MTTPEPLEKPAATARSGTVVHAPSWRQRAAAWVVFSLIRSVSATVRYRWVDRSGCFKGQTLWEPAIYCVWHNRLALCMIVYDYVKKRNRAAGLAAIVSASKDGGFLTAVLECFKVEPVRGSSSRRGRQALLELMTWAERGYNLAITPDGPRGPRYAVQEGVAFLAQLTGLPIVPVSYHLSSKIQARSWDRFQIPLPFSVCEVIFEKPIRIPREATEQEREAWRLQLEQTLQSISRD